MRAFALAQNGLADDAYPSGSRPGRQRRDRRRRDRRLPRPPRRRGDRRPSGTGYASRRWAKTKNPRSRKTLASSTMIVTGTIVLLFVVTHLADVQVRHVSTKHADGTRDIYRLQLAVFSSPAYVAFYLVAMAIIFFHLWHGISSAAQSLGIGNAAGTPGLLGARPCAGGRHRGGFAILPIYTFILSKGVL